MWCYIYLYTVSSRVIPHSDLSDCYIEVLPHMGLNITAIAPSIADDMKSLISSSLLIWILYGEVLSKEYIFMAQYTLRCTALPEHAQHK